MLNVFLIPKIKIMKHVLLSLMLFTGGFLFAQTCPDGSYQFSDMVSIFTNNGCTNCHGFAGGLNLSDYANVTTGGNQGAGGCGPYADPLSFLVGKIDGSLTAADACGNAMPQGIGYGNSAISAGDLAAIQTWIDAGASEICALLSVELIQFEAKAGEKEIVLSWSTETEHNNAFFEIERSTNGRDFESIGIVEGAGDSNQKLEYFLIDNHPIPGMNYYRIVQHDFDGASHYFKVTSANFESISGFVNLRPNPFNELLQMEYISGGEEYFFLTIFNSQGQIVQREKAFLNQGLNVLTFNTINLPKGFYYLSMFTDENAIYSSRILKQ